MQVLYYGAMGAIVLSALTTLTLQRSHDAPEAVSRASAQVDQYRMFMYVASQYMKNYSGGAAQIPWTTLRTVSTAPSGARTMAMPATWKVVAASDNTWVACTAMDERAIGMIQQLAVQGGQSLNKTQVSGADYVVVGSESDVGKAASCT